MNVKKTTSPNFKLKTPHSELRNHIAIAPIIRCVFLTGFLTLMGVGFVHIKNQQHSLGSEMRILERKVRDVRTYNQALLTEVTHLTCRTSLQEKLASGFIKMVAIQDTSIARLTPPTPATQSLEIRTAANRNF